MKNRHSLAVAMFTGLTLLGMSLWGSQPAIADSPLTSTDLATAYEDLLEVRVARHWKRAERLILDFLLSDAPLDQKIAVVNALGWDIDQQNNGALFVRGIAQREGISLDKMTLDTLVPDDWAVLGYLLAMDNYHEIKPLGAYFEPEDRLSAELQQVLPEDLLSRAVNANPSNFSAQFVASLVEAQLSFERSWCDVYLEPALVLDRFPTTTSRNMRPQAVNDAMEYLNLYQSYCSS